MRIPDSVAEFMHDIGLFNGDDAGAFISGLKYSLPKRRNPKKPPYPSTLKTQGIEADVTVLVNVSAQGKVTSVKIIKEAPYPEFNQAARQTALAEEFDPATRDGVPISTPLTFTYHFRLEDE